MLYEITYYPIKYDTVTDKGLVDTKAKLTIKISARGMAHAEEKFKETASGVLIELKPLSPPMTTAMAKKEFERAQQAFYKAQEKSRLLRREADARLKKAQDALDRAREALGEEHTKYNHPFIYNKGTKEEFVIDRIYSYSP